MLSHKVGSIPSSSVKSKPKSLSKGSAAESELAREDWDFRGEEAISGDTTLLRAQLLWEICRHLVIDSASGGILEGSDPNGIKKIKPRTGYAPFGQLGPKFINYFPGGSLAVSAVVQQFLDQQGTDADLKIRIRKKLPAWLPCNFPPWASERVTDENRERFVQLAWQLPVEKICIRTESDVDDLSRSLKQQVRNTAAFRASSLKSPGPPIIHLAIRSFAWDHYPRKLIDQLVFQAIKGIKSKPKGITKMQLKSKLMDLRLLRLVLAYGKEKSRLIVKDSTTSDLKNYGSDKRVWSPDWAKKCTAAIRFLCELFPENRGIVIIKERFDEVTTHRI